MRALMVIRYFVAGLREASLALVTTGSLIGGSRSEMGPVLVPSTSW